ncbi:MAG: RNA polymerase subunit sigma-24 [Bacteroidetes bacterium]|nr:MAG: RNA polymerase subunit sigma-24 [Bacteroidota bacterium]
MSVTKIILHSTDQEILHNLNQPGLMKRRGEEQFFNTYMYFIREGMQKHSLSEDEAFDAYSDSILSAIDKIIHGGFEGRSTLKTWLYQIFHHKCVDLIRKKTTNKSSVHQTITLADMLFQISDTAKSVVQNLIDKTDWEQLRAKLNQLGENCRQMLMLSAEGFSDKDISGELGYKTADVVKTSRLRCLEKLRQLYKAP